MDITVLTALLSPCLPFLLKLGNEVVEGAASKVGNDTWEKAKQVWSKLQPHIETKSDAKTAAEQVAAQPESKGRQAFLQEELAILLKEQPDLEKAIAQIMTDGKTATPSIQIKQTVDRNSGQVIGQMTGGTVINNIEKNI